MITVRLFIRDKSHFKIIREINRKDWKETKKKLKRRRTHNRTIQKISR